MDHRFQRWFGSVLLAASLLGVPVACTTYMGVPSGPRHRDRIVGFCHQSVRAQVNDRFGRSARVGFDTPETYYVSTGLQGVRGGGVIGKGGDRVRIQYDCAVDIHTGRVVHVTHRLIDAVWRRSEWSIDACHDRIRHAAASDHGRRTTVDFEKAETWFISLDREGVRGGADLASGSRREKIRYECEVDITRGRVDAASYRSTEKPTMTDAEALQLCRGAITNDVQGDRGKRAKVSFGENDVYVISGFEKGIRGGAEIRSGKDRDRIAYECTVNTRRERVTAASYRTLERSRPSDKRLVEMCQNVTREMVAADHGRHAGVEFAGAQIFAVSEREAGIRGEGLLNARGNRDPIRYSCTVDLRKVKVTAARYRPVEPPPETAQRTVDLCLAELRDEISSDRGRSASLEFETAETYFVSQAVEGVRGTGVVRIGRRDRDPIRYECEVNIRSGKVKEARYRYR